MTRISPSSFSKREPVICRFSHPRGEILEFSGKRSLVVSYLLQTASKPLPIPLASNMRKCLSLLSLFFLLLIFFTGTGEQNVCPEPNDILPCICIHDESPNTVTVDCSGASSIAEMFTIFNEAPWPLTELTRFNLTYNEAIQELPAGVFGDVSFEELFIYRTSTSNVHPDALLPLKERLRDLQIGVQNPCPEPNDILPCICIHEGSPDNVTVDCSEVNSIAEVSSVFNKDVWPFTELKRFNLTYNEAIQELPAGVFGDVSFEELFIYRTSMSNVHPDALLPLKERLRDLQIGYGALESFPWDILPEFKNLFRINLHNNAFNAWPLIQSESLNIIILTQSKVSYIESGFHLPSLRVLDVGLTVNTKLTLSRNKIEELTEEVFLPMFDVLSRGNGSIDLRGNLMILMEYCPNGSLESFLRQNQNQYVDLIDHQTGKICCNRPPGSPHGNVLTTLPHLRSASLTYFDISSNVIAELEAGSSLPNLTSLVLSYNPISEVPPGFFSDMGNLVEFYCLYCSLGPTLSTRSFDFHGAPIRYVLLTGNPISTLELDAITGPTQCIRKESIEAVPSTLFLSPNHFPVSLAFKMQGFLVFLSLFVLYSVPGTSGQTPCPDPEDITPCTCSHNAFHNTVTVDCSGATSSEEIFSVFNGASWLFPNLTKFQLTNNEGVDELPEGVFGDVTFEEILVRGSAVASIHPAAVLPSNDRLRRLEISLSVLREFPWDVLPEFSDLTSLHFYSNVLTTLPHLRSASLTYFDISSNEIAELEAGSSLPNLTSLVLSYNPISEVPPGFFSDMGNLVEFYCLYCSLGPTLSTRSFDFHGAPIRYVLLTGNPISTLELDAITGGAREFPVFVPGLGFHTEIYLNYNEIKELREDSFRPMLEVLSLGDGYIDLECEILLAHNAQR
ncbi:unnamed protein product [Darwinula stevensoni]|uniref:Uncharacterized protein n=1 Tax=Darwinula stevensoni TaxID=69355 RepID=A0A7R8XE99_9CRUS|nr:unnamed protein product [Darwinula stevensoni]CAG0895573.1 unnamed protein product [Darwinula stevensoni]